MKKIKINILPVLLVLLTLFIFNARPGILGQKFGGVFFLIAISVFGLTILGSKWKRILIKKEVLIIYILYIIMYTYGFIQLWILNIHSYSAVINSLLLITIGMLGFVTFSHNDLKNSIRAVSIIFVIITISYIISYVLIFMRQELILMNIVLPMSESSEYIYPVYFPFSIFYDGSVRILTERIPRAIANYREPGLLQLIMIFLFWINYFIKIKNYKLINIFIVLLFLLTFSTAGYICFAISIIVYYIVNYGLSIKGIVAPSFVLVIFIILLFFSDTQFAIESKFDNQSGMVRLEALLMSIELLKNNPLIGIGFYQTIYDVSLGINFIGTIAQLGIIGTIITILPIIYTFYIASKYDKKYLVILVPLLITLLFSQPLYDKAITVYMLSLIVYLAKYGDTKNFNNHSILQPGNLPGRDNPIHFKAELSKA